MRKRLLAPEKLMWRQGRKVGRTVYAMVGLLADDHDLLIGMFDTAKLAEAAVRAHNSAMIRKVADRPHRPS
jgi:hypothetical protein